MRYDATANVAANLRIRTFESEVDPFAFSLLDSGHFVLFRNVWHDNQRLVQGALLDQAAFLQIIFRHAFADTTLAEMSNLLVAYGDDVLLAVDGRDNYRVSRSPLDGTLLYRRAMSAPFDGIELVLTVTKLPPGPGGPVLAWVAVVLVVVLTGGFFGLYRLGLSQIRLARQQQDFVSAVSHELKTPLTSIRMYGEILKEGWADEARRQDYYAYIHDESERLTRMISNVLQLANITRNEPNFELRNVSTGELMGNLESKIAAQIERAGFALEMRRDSRADRKVLAVDEDCLAQIVINLVDNALKFSKNADTRTIQLGSAPGPGNTVCISVRDFGPGIASDQMKKIFGLFYRAENELTRETVGTGIGLAIVHQLAQAMGAAVDVVNESPGTRFTVTFPAVSA
jgi:signal transduction histidine kinase